MANCNPERTTQGVNTKLGFAASDTVSAPTDPTEQLEYDDQDYTLEIENQDTSGIRGTEAMPTERYVEMSRNARGGFNCRPTGGDLERWLPRILGGALGSPTTGLKTVLMAETRPCFDVFAYINSNLHKYRQQRVVSANFTASERQPLRMSVQSVGTDRDALVNPYTWPALVIPTAGKPFIFPQLQITVGGTAYDIYNFSLSFQYAIDTQYMNSVTPTAFPSAARTIRLAVRFPWKVGPAIFDLYRNAAVVAALVTLDYGATSTRRTLIFDTPYTVAEGLREPGVPGKASIPWDLNLAVGYDTTAGPSTQVSAKIRAAGE